MVERIANKPIIKETKVEPVRFSDEARSWLEKEKYLIYPLTGQSIKTQEYAGRPFYSTWHNRNPDFEALASRNSEVAIRPDQLFLPKSSGKSLDDQLGMVARMSADMSRQVRGAQPIIGEAPDYIELAFKHLDTTGQRLFGEDFGYGYARTVTPVGGGVAIVGGFIAGRRGGLNVGSWLLDGKKLGGLWVRVAPLIVPAEPK